LSGGILVNPGSRTGGIQTLVWIIPVELVDFQGKRLTGASWPATFREFYLQQNHTLGAFRPIDLGRV
jgi:hypothetical protein